MVRPRKPRAEDEVTGESVNAESAAQGNESATPEPQTEDPDLIARRAYERYQMRGGEHGHDQEDWFEAERELNEKRGG